MAKKINLAVIFGGRSGEHEVSLSSVKGVIAALDKEKYNVIPVAITKKGNWLVGQKGSEYLKLYGHLAGKENAISLSDSQSLVTIDAVSINRYSEGDTIDHIDLVLPIIHGPYGEDGRLQGMLDMLGMPYVFSGVLAHAIAMNKPKAKIIAKSNGVPVAKDIILKDKKRDHSEMLRALSLALPLVVKPAELGSSVGIIIAKTEEELRQGIENAFTYGEEVIVEQYIKGREFTVTVMGNADPRVLAVTEIIPKISEFYDYEAKYEEGGSEHVCPAKLSDDQNERIKKYAVLTYQAIGCRDLARIDFLLSEKDGEFYFIDTNTIPGMTPTSLAPEAAKAAGMDFSQFLDILIEEALKRNELPK